MASPDPRLAGIARLRENVRRVFVGAEATVERVIVTLLAAGHVLIEDVPGVGKTTLARAVARSIDGTFRRIQFTPDLLPSDVLGVSIYDPRKDEFVFKRGPLFASVVLADEINRASPRTQSALLEALNDLQVSVDGATHDLPQPFFVLATQNPLDHEGTFPLPESELDRFLLRLRVGYPSFEEEREVLVAQQTEHPLASLQPVVTADEVRAMQTAVREIRVDPSLVDYIVHIVRSTRDAPAVAIGCSPRGALALRRAAQARAAYAAREFVTPDDVKALAVPCLAHRLLLRSGRNGRDEEATLLIEEVLARTPVPV